MEAMRDSHPACEHRLRNEYDLDHGLSGGADGACDRIDRMTVC